MAFHKPISLEIEAGLSIAELYGLDQHDPWKPETEESLDNRVEALQKKIADRWEKEGFFDEPEFIDPQNDDNPSILEKSSLSLFWRLCIVGKRLIEIVALEPSIRKISLASKNTSTGCWIAFPGKRIAMKIDASLKARGIVACLTSCDINGQTSGMTSSKADEFYYCIAEYHREIYAFFVPGAFWDTHGDVFTGDLGISDRIDSLMTQTVLSYRYKVKSSDMLHTKVALDRMGFRENLLFQSCINDAYTI